MTNNKQTGNTNTILIVVVLVIIVALGAWYFSTKSATPATEDGGFNVDVTVPTGSGEATVPTGSGGGSAIE